MADSRLLMDSPIKGNHQRNWTIENSELSVRCTYQLPYSLLSRYR